MRKCPKCALPVQGQPRNCPHCGYEFRAHDPGRCEFCGTKIKASMDNCPNCGAPAEHAPQPLDDTPEVTVFSSSSSTTSSPPTMSTSRGPDPATKAIKIVGCVVGLMILLPILFGVVFPVLLCSDSDRGSTVVKDSVLDERLVTITMAEVEDSIYRASIIEGENTVEEIWPRVITDLPDSCYYPDAYDPCAAFQIHVEGGHSLIRLDASAPIDLVMTLLRRNENDTLTYAGWNEDGDLGQDPSITSVLTGGDYIALVTNLGGWEFGEVRFLWTVLLEEIPTIAPDTALELAFTDRIQEFYFFVDIEQGREYTISSSSEDIDTFVELRTEGGSVLSDDDSGPNWSDALLTFTASALNAGEAVLVVRPYSTYSTYTGDVTLELSSRSGEIEY